jgi:hypothetical protein
MKRLTVLVTLAVLRAGLILFSLNDTAISVADTSILNNEVITSHVETSNYSASATITITMYTVDGELPS